MYEPSRKEMGFYNPRSHLDSTAMTYSPDSNTYILGEYDKYLSEQSELFLFFTICGSKLNNYYSIFARMLFNIRFAYYSTKIPEVRYSPRQQILNLDPALPKFDVNCSITNSNQSGFVS